MELERMWDVGAVVLSGVVPGVVVAKCLAVAGALAFSSWCATIVILAAGMSHIHGSYLSLLPSSPSLSPLYASELGTPLLPYRLCHVWLGSHLFGLPSLSSRL